MALWSPAKRLNLIFLPKITYILIIIDDANGLAPATRQAISVINDDLLWIIENMDQNPKIFFKLISEKCCLKSVAIFPGDGQLINKEGADINKTYIK